MRVNLSSIRASLLVALFIVISFSIAPDLIAQTDDPMSLRQKAIELFEKDNFIAAGPLFERVLEASPNDADAHFYYGFCLLAQAQGLKDPSAAQKFRFIARNELLKAKELGSKIELIDPLLESLPEDGKVKARFSDNAAAENLMIDGESAFTQGNHDKALELYGKALALDPKIYSAALFSGDMHMRKNDFESAEIWYQKAIAIDPMRETAYRYSATPLMKQGRFDAALPRYIQAYITEPYNRFATNGIVGWANATETRVSHPSVNIPVKFEKDGTSTINFDPNNKNSLVWMSYTATRLEWKDKKFLESHPKEKVCRHSLKEEAAALRSVLRAAESLGEKADPSDPTIVNLTELEKKGFLEAFILLVLADEGIALDHRAYLESNREKLTSYVSEIVVKKKQ